MRVAYRRRSARVLRSVAGPNRPAANVCLRHRGSSTRRAVARRISSRDVTTDRAGRAPRKYSCARVAGEGDNTGSGAKLIFMLPQRSDGAAPLALIVDRDDDTRLLYGSFFEINHWRVVGAAGGPEALAKAIAERPDVVITETLLPGFDGVALSELLRTDFTTAHIPIVFVTSDATPASVARAEATGAQAVLTKPCLPEDLLKAVSAACRRAEDLRVRVTA